MYFNKEGRGLLIRNIKNIKLLGYNNTIGFNRWEDGLHINFPKENSGTHAFFLKN